MNEEIKNDNKNEYYQITKTRDIEIECEILKKKLNEGKSLKKLVDKHNQKYPEALKLEIKAQGHTGCYELNGYSRTEIPNKVYVNEYGSFTYIKECIKNLGKDV